MEPNALLTWLVIICTMSHNVSGLDAPYQHLIELQQLIPAEEYCNVNWILSTSKSCSWCESMLNSMNKLLTKQYYPLRIFKNTSESTKRFPPIAFLSKGTCVVSYFIADQFHDSSTVSWSDQRELYAPEFWFIFTEVCFILNTLAKISWKNHEVYCDLRYEIMVTQSTDISEPIFLVGDDYARE